MLNRNIRHTLLSALLLFVVFSGIYFLTISLRQYRPGYILSLLILLYSGTALNRARSVVSPPRFPIMRETPKDLGLPAFEEVVFYSGDGVDLDGWYIPSTNRAAVILVHSLGSSRMQMRHYARALTAKGFGVLLFDLRAHARSGGGTSTFGWIEHEDLLAAHAFLSEKADIDPARIGVIGFSMGAQVAIRGAAADGPFAAVWVDGLIPIVYADHFVVQKRGFRQFFFSPWWWLAYQTQGWLTGIQQPEPLTKVIAKLSPKPLMVVAAGSDRLIDLGRAFFEAAAEPKEFWQLDDIPFGSGILEFGDDYDLKLVGFFNRALLREPEKRAA